VQLLDDAALAAARQWKFVPTLLNGVPVAVAMTVTISFTTTR
jgi:TonB family protein